ncbi:MAG: hypothetical protein WCL39_08940 [Armatimonadota bacterium]
MSKSLLFLAAVLLFLQFGCSPTVTTSAAPPVRTAKVVKVSMVTTTSAPGASAYEVLISWKNTGSQSINSVFADIDLYDSANKKLDSGASDYCIFASLKRETAVLPGKTYIESKGNGYLVIVNPRVEGFGTPVKCFVKITRAE